MIKAYVKGDGVKSYVVACLISIEEDAENLFGEMYIVGEELRPDASPYRFVFKKSNCSAETSGVGKAFLRMLIDYRDMVYVYKFLTYEDNNGIMAPWIAGIENYKGDAPVTSSFAIEAIEYVKENASPWKEYDADELFAAYRVNPLTFDLAKEKTKNKILLKLVEDLEEFDKCLTIENGIV